VKIDENIRGCDVFLVQPTCRPVNHNLMELLVMIDACRRASAQRITTVIPYFGYARQDRKDQPRVPISSKLVANLITASGASRLLCMDLHAAQIQGFFDIPVDHLFALPVFLDYFKESKVENPVVVSPDAGGVERARAFAKRLNASLAIIDKRREGPNKAQVMNIIGDVKGKTAIMIDDMIDTAGTLTLGAEAIRAQGATEVYAAASHAVFSGDAIPRIVASCLKEVVVTNSIPVPEEQANCGKVRVLSIAPILGEAIYRIHKDLSVSSLFV
jgi:ribose-phosphate pyrophosphokinase